MPNNRQAIYELVSTQDIFSYAFSLEPQDSIPQVYCSECQGRHCFGSMFPLPEASAMPYNNPLLTRVRRMTDDFSEQRGEATKLWMDKVFQGGRPLKIDKTEAQELERVGTLLPDEFKLLADEIQRELRLPPENVVKPGARLGLRELAWNGKKPVDWFFFQPAGDEIVTRRRIVNTFIDQGITGWISYPAIVSIVKPSAKHETDLHFHELIVTGKAGVPRNVESDSYQQLVCATCGWTRLRLVGDFPETPLLSEEQWDGSDVFRFTFSSVVYVTERVKSLLETMKCTGVMCKPLG